MSQALLAGLLSSSAVLVSPRAKIAALEELLAGGSSHAGAS